MKTLDTLIRVHEWKLNEERRKLADLIGLSDELRECVSRIEQEIQSEGALTDQSIDAARSYSTFLKSQMQRRETLESSMAKVETQIAEIQERVAAAFKELKTYEISRDRRNAAMARERARREQSSLDEIALNMHRMKSGG